MCIHKPDAIPSTSFTKRKRRISLFESAKGCKGFIFIMDGHHLILGELADFVTGETLQDTHDERYRQSIARFLVEQKGYGKKDIRPRRELRVTAGEKCATIKIDFSIVANDRIYMIIRYAPGSLVTRHRPSLAVSRTLTPYQIPVVVVTNGIEADIIDGRSAKVTARGLDGIPDKHELLEKIQEHDFVEIPKQKAEKESRIIFAFDVDDRCPCDDTICRINA
jgi:hypothetical protein